MFKRTLIAGPWLNELGWEIMIWQAAVRYRRIRGNFDKTIVITFPGRDILYENCDIYPHNHELINAPTGVSRLLQSDITKLVNKCLNHYQIEPGYSLFTPNDYLSFSSRLLRKLRTDLTFRDFSELGSNHIEYDLLFHFRDFERRNDDYAKCYPHDAADFIANYFLQRGLRIGCIGSSNYSYVAKGCINLQANSLRETLHYLNSTKLIAGGSSAPLHLAALCKTPHVFWNAPPGREDRYFTWGNPFRTPVFMVSNSTFQPDPQDVIKQIEIAFSKLVLN